MTNGGYKMDENDKNFVEPRDCVAGEQMEFIEWLADEYPDFYTKIVKEWNEGRGD